MNAKELEKVDTAETKVEVTGCPECGADLEVVVTLRPANRTANAREE